MFIGKFMKNVVFILYLFVAFGCASIKHDFVFDGSTPQSIKSDINHVSGKLNRSDRLEFSLALLAIQFSDVNSVKEILGDPTMETTNYFILSKKIDGLTYIEILELASKSKSKVEVITK